MYASDSETFGKFFRECRKEKKLTQKDIADKLFVSDKTISKWECGTSMPDIAMLIPIADILGVSVQELLKGKREKEHKEDVSDMESSQFVRRMLHKKKRYWIYAYFICLLITAIEISMLMQSGMALSQLTDNVIVACMISLFFCGWFCFFAKDVLPVYYDEHRINYVSQGIVRLHIPGLAFHNGNWHTICVVSKVSFMAIAIVCPLLCCLFIMMGSVEMWEEMKTYVILMLFLAMVGAIYIIGKKYA